jgi:Mg/Co/Ni transporter MgtE
VGKPKDWSRNVKTPDGLHEAVDALAGDKMKKALRVLTKGDRRQALTLVDQLVLSSLASQVRMRIGAAMLRPTPANSCTRVTRSIPSRTSRLL